MEEVVPYLGRAVRSEVDGTHAGPSVSSDSRDVWSANAPSGGMPSGGSAVSAPTFAILAADFVEVLALFVRTIPLYPDGHGRVVAVSNRLQETASALHEPQVIEVAEQGFLVNGKERAELPPGPLALREALLSTAVVRVVFQPTTPSSSYVAFARTLHRNARLAGSAQLSFADLWMGGIPGIEVHELVFDTDGFLEMVEDASSTIAPLRVLGSTESAGGGSEGSVAGSTGAGDQEGAEVRPAPLAPTEKKAARTVHTVARDLRELVLDDPTLAAGLLDLAGRLVGNARSTRSGADLLEHLVRVLPIEARLDTSKGLEIVRKVLSRILAHSPEVPAIDETPDLATRFFQTLESVFPKRVRDVDAAPASPEAAIPHASGSPLDDLLALDDSLLDEWGGLDDEGPPPAPELVATVGIVDPSAVLLHAFMEEPAGARRDVLRAALLAAYATRPKGAGPPCILAHLAEALKPPPASRDAARIELLASILDEARIESPPGASPITSEVAITLFPLCLSTYVRSGGRAGPIARGVGHDAVLAAAPRLVAPGGGLFGDALDHVLLERSFDILPFIEALLLADRSSRARAVRALRVLDLKSLAAVALRVVPEARFTDRFLASLCADGFSGADSRHLLPEAAAALGDVVLDEEGVLDMKTRIYATAALGAFPIELAESPLRAVTSRRLFGAAPKELRRAAEEVLQRLARAAALARPVP